MDEDLTDRERVFLTTVKDAGGEIVSEEEMARILGWVDHIEAMYTTLQLAFEGKVVIRWQDKDEGIMFRASDAMLKAREE